MTLDSPASIVLVALAVVVELACVVVSAMKRRVGLIAFGLFLTFGVFGPYAVAVVGPAVPVYGACRLARPTSFWARRYYAPEKMALAVERFT